MLINKKNSQKKITAIFAVVLATGMFFSYPQKTQAAFWPAIDPIMNRMLDTVYETVQGMILGSLKQVSVKILNNRIDVLISGQGADNAAFITDWKDYLITAPQNNAKLYLNSYLADMTSGRGTSTGYIAEGFSGSGNYANTLTQAAKNTIEKAVTVPAMTYEGDPSQMFAGGTFKNIGVYTSGVNNPWSFNMSVEGAYQKKVTEEQALQQVQAVAYQGFKGVASGTGADKLITRPGSLTKDMVSNIENLPNNVLASARNIPEVISSVVSQMITKALQQGFNGIQKSVQSQNSSQSRLDAGTNSAIEKSGPAARLDVVGR